MDLSPKMRVYVLYTRNSTHARASRMEHIYPYRRGTDFFAHNTHYAFPRTSPHRKDAPRRVRGRVRARRASSLSRSPKFSFAYQSRRFALALASSATLSAQRLSLSDKTRTSSTRAKTSFSQGASCIRWEQPPPKQASQPAISTEQRLIQKPRGYRSQGPLDNLYCVVNRKRRRVSKRCSACGNIYFLRTMHGTLCTNLVRTTRTDRPVRKKTRSPVRRMAAYTAYSVEHPCARTASPTRNGRKFVASNARIRL